MKKLRVAVCASLLLCTLYKVEMKAPFLYETENTLNYFSLVCTWSIDDVEHFEGQPVVRWMLNDLGVFEYNSQLCILENIGKWYCQGAEVQHGYMYLVLTVGDRKCEGTWQCTLPPFSERSNSVLITNSYFLNTRRPNYVVYPGSTYSVILPTGNRRSICGITFNRHNYTSAIRIKCYRKLFQRIFRHGVHIDCSKKTYVTVTLTNVSMDDHGTIFSCKGFKNLKIMLIVVDLPDLEQNVVVSQSPGTQNDISILVCTTPCETEYNFFWNYGITGIPSKMKYDSCKHTCSQILIVLDQNALETQIQCTVANPRTARTSTAQYVLSPRPSVSPRSSPLSLPLPLAAALGGIGGILLIGIVTSILYIKRKRMSGTGRSNSSEVGGEYVDAVTLRGNGSNSDYAEIGEEDSMNVEYAEIVEDIVPTDEPGSQLGQIDDYEEPVVGSTGQFGCPEGQTDDYEEPVVVSTGQLGSPLGQLDDYEEPVVVSTGQLGSPLGQTDDYEEPVVVSTGQLGSPVGQLDDYEESVVRSTGSPLRQIDDYEEPVVGSTGQLGSPLGQTDDYEEPVVEPTGQLDSSVEQLDDSRAPATEPRGWLVGPEEKQYDYKEPLDDPVEHECDTGQLSDGRKREERLRQQKKDITGQDHAPGPTYNKLSQYVAPGDMTFYRGLEYCVNRENGSTSSSPYLDMIG